MAVSKILIGLTLPAILLLTLNCLSQNNISLKIDEYINREMRSQKIPGVAVAVIRDGRIVLAKGYGLSDLEHQIPVKPETVFQSGSLGKAFTVTAVMMLVEDGKISLNDKLIKYFADAPKEWDNITIRHLLEHTSGMTGYPEEFDFRIDRSEEDLYNLIKSIPLAFKLGEKRGYSNLGFVMLGILIQKVTGKFYGDFLSERIFKPLNMTTARVISEADIISNRASGYRLVNDQLKNQEWVAPSLNTTADGALYLSILDVARWEAALHSEKLLTKKSYEAMWTNVITNDGVQQPYGFSWQIERINGRRIIEHSGGWQGFTANFSRYPALKLAVIVFTNLRGVDPINLTRGIQEIYQPELSISGAIPLPDKEPKITEFVKDLVQKITAKTLTADLFVPPAGDGILPNAHHAAKEFGSYGELKNIELVDRQENPNGTQTYHYRLNYESKAVIISVGLTPNGKINSIGVRRS